MDRQTLLLSALHAGRQRLTRQRLLILQTLEASQGHLDAEDIHARVREQDARVSLATVYRTLALFKALGLVQEHSLGEEHGHFEVTQSAPHYHFTCRRCHRVIEFESQAMTRSVQKLAEQMGWQVTEVNLALYGYCAACRQEEEHGHVV